MTTNARFRLCLVCSRAVPVDSKELYCINDGSRLLDVCPRCEARITSPYAQFCPACGQEYRSFVPEPDQTETSARGTRRQRSETREDKP